MEVLEQVLVESMSDVQMIDIDQLFPKTRERIFQGKKLNHGFNTLPPNVVEGKPAIFNSHKDERYIEVFIDQVQRINMGGLVFWHEVDIKSA